MNRVSMMLAGAATLLFAVSPALAASDLESEFKQMKEAMEGLKQKVEAQEEQIEHQGEMLDQAQTAVRDQQKQAESLSGLSTFLDSVEVDGHIAGSYNYNFNTPKGTTDGPLGDLGGADQNVGTSNATFLPFHRDNNTFTIDQIWFGIGKPATEESPAGFRFDILYGQNADYLGQGGQLNNNGNQQSRRTHNYDGTSDYYISQAYIEYTCSCIHPVNMKFGKFQTMVGAEVAQATGNFNITRGQVYTFLQPVDHLGLLGTTDLGPVELQFGIANSGSSLTSSPDTNKEKSYIGSAMIGDDRMSVRTSFIYGGENIPNAPLVQDNSAKTGLVDVTAWFNPTDNVSLWVNYNYLYYEGSALYANGVAVAGRVGITDKIGAALRGEYVQEHVAQTSSNDFTGILSPNENQTSYSLTGTVDYSLTDHLTARGEVRFDWINNPGGHGIGFENNYNGSSDNQTVGLVEVVYEF